MRVLQLTDSYPPTSGGLAGHVQRLGRGLLKAGHEVTIVTAPHPEMPKRDNGVEIRTIEAGLGRLPGAKPRGEMVLHPLRDRRLQRKLQRIVDQWKPDLIHAHGWSLFQAARLNLPDNVQRWTTLHDHCFHCPRRMLMRQPSNAPCNGRVSRFTCIRCMRYTFDLPKSLVLSLGYPAIRRLLKRLDGAVAVSESVASQWRNLAKGPEIVVVSNMVDMPTTPIQPHPSDDDLKLMFLGGTGAGKGLDLASEAVRQLRTEGEAISLTSVGTTSANLSPIDGVVHIDRLPHHEIATSLDLHHLLLVPSTMKDSCPTVIMEAMAQGRAAIGTAHGGTVDLIEEGKTGWLVEPGSVKALVLALRDALKDRQRVIEMGIAARERLIEGGFTTKSVVSSLESLWWPK